MPLNMPDNLTDLKNQLSQPGAWVWLMIVTLPNSGPTLRFTDNSENVVYGGQTFVSFNFGIDSFSCNTDGEIPEFTMVVTNVGYVLQEYMREYGGLIGGTISYVQVNTEYLAEDYSEDQVTWTITGAKNTWPDVIVSLSVPPAIRGRVPEDRLNPYACRHAFRTPAGEYTTRCGYTGASLDGVTLPSGNPVAVEQEGHGFSTGDEVRIFDMVGIAGLDGDYTVTVVDPDNFTLDDTDGDDFSGSFTSGSAGYAWCPRNPDGCLARGMFPGNYGGPLGLRREAIRYA